MPLSNRTYCGAVWHWRAMAIALACLSGAQTARGQLADDVPWEISPYRVRVTLAANTAQRPELDLEALLRRTVVDRVLAGLRPLCDVEVEVAAGPHERRQCLAPRELKWDDLGDARTQFDKLFWLGIEAAPAGYTIVCREYDVPMRRWSAPATRTFAQRMMLGDACFDALLDSFSPLARIEPGGEKNQVRLLLKGGALPPPPAARRLVQAGDAFLPVLRRSRRGGPQADGGLAVLPWTYLVAEEASGDSWMAAADTALGEPFGGRRRGTVEQLAVRLPRDAAPARVRFFARSNREQPLAGYEVFRLPGGGGQSELVGLTDGHGIIEVPPGERATTTLMLRSDGQVLAKLVVAAGAAVVLEAPIADDAVRLAAQAEVRAMREELIDVVARRAIMIARIKRLLKDGKGDEARELMAELADLPTPSMFSSRMDAVRERLPQSEDPRVKQTVDNLFSSTMELLTRFLDARTITMLQAEVNAAPRDGS